MPPVAASPTKKPTTPRVAASPKKAAASPVGAKSTTTTSAASPTKKKSTAKKATAAATPDLTKERYSMGIAPKHNLSFCGAPTTSAKKAAATPTAAVASSEDGAAVENEVSVAAPYATSSVVLRAIAEGYVPKGMEVYVETVKAQQARIAAQKAQPAAEVAPVVAPEEEASPLKKKGAAVAPKKVHAAAPKKKTSKKAANSSSFSTRSGALRVYGQLAHAFVESNKKVAAKGEEGGAEIATQDDEEIPSNEDATAAMTHLGVAHLHCFGGTGEPSAKKKTKAAAATPAGPQPSLKKSYGYFFAAGSPKATGGDAATPTAQTLLSRYYMATQQLRGQGTDKSVHAAQEAFNFVIANEAVDKSLAAASLYQLGRLHETGKFVEVAPRDVTEDAASPVKGSTTSKTPVSSPRGPAARPTTTTKPSTSSSAKQPPAASGNQDAGRVAATVLKVVEDGSGAMAPTPVWITTVPASENSAIDMYKQAAARGSEDAQRRVDMLLDAQAARKRKENELAARKAQREAALAAAATA